VDPTQRTLRRVAARTEDAIGTLDELAERQDWPVPMALRQQLQTTRGALVAFRRALPTLRDTAEGEAA
jgi:hypothetical protein